MGNGGRGTPRQAVLGQVVPRGLVGASRVAGRLCGAEADAPAIVDGIWHPIGRRRQIVQICNDHN